MKQLIVKTTAQITAFNAAITPLMLAAGHKMDRWVDVEQCPVNSVTGEIAIITESTGVRRKIIEKYLADNNLHETEISADDENWFPKMEFMS